MSESRLESAVGTVDEQETDTGGQITLPRLGVDEDASLDERLTDAVQEQIGPERYFQSEDGDPYEDWGDVFERVAQNMAIPEIVHHEIPISIGREELADWVDDETADELLGGHAGMTDLDETVAPYVDAEALRERVSSAPGGIADTYDRYAASFERAMRQQLFMPNTPTLINAGTELQQLSACFVLEPGDSLVEDEGCRAGRDSIMTSATDAAEILQSGGGVGYPFHHLRPKGARIETTDGVSSGPMSFMEIYDTVCGTIQQGGVRRGAQMGVMHVQHPDIGRFVTAKRGEDALTNFNISVGMVDEFLNAVVEDEQYVLTTELTPASSPETGGDDPDPWTVVPETAHFYDPAFEDAWNEQMNKPAEGYDGKVIKENFWRDYQSEMQDPAAFDKFRDRIDLEPGEPMTLPAQFIWQLIIDGAHNNGEPGFVYLDEINSEHSFDVDEHPERFIHSTNPCAEQPLVNGEACNLGHVNLSLLLEDEAPTYDAWLDTELPDFEEWNDDLGASAYLSAALDQQLLEQTVRTGTRFLDNVVTMSKFPTDDIEDAVSELRKIGLGVMGFHQMLLQMGVEYGSDVSIEIGREIMRRIDAIATDESAVLADERGVFPAWDESKWADLAGYPEWAETHAHVSEAAIEAGQTELPVRNHNVTTVAPTGTTSLIGNTTGGIEPLYNVAYFKNVSDDVQGEEMLVEVDEYFKAVCSASDGIDTDAVLAELEDLMLANEFDDLEDLSTVPDELADVFVTTDDLEVDDHIDIQAAFQEYVDSGISKTLNMANDTTIEETGEALYHALDSDIKGATLYRIGSRASEVKTTNVTGGGLTIQEASDRDLVEELVTRTVDTDAAVHSASISIDAETTSAESDIEQELTVGELSAD